MRRLLKFLHEVAAVGVIGAFAAALQSVDLAGPPQDVAGQFDGTVLFPLGIP